MRPLETAFVSVLVVAMSGVASTADATDAQILGTWRTPKHDGKVVIEACGAALCGHVIDGRELRANPNQTDVRNPDASKRDRKILGLNILEGYTGGPTEWTGGSIYDPQTGDSSSNSTLTLVSPHTLIVKGCRFVFCRSETWIKIASSGP